MTRTPSPDVRRRLFAAWGHACAYCGGRADHLDHVIPKSRGGANNADNRLPACQTCGSAKGARSLAEWLADIATTGSRSARPTLPRAGGPVAPVRPGSFGDNGDSWASIAS